MTEQNNKNLKFNSIKIVDIKPKFFFKYNLGEHTTCGICQMEFEATCGAYEHPLSCLPTKGSCNHCFHKHCLKNWLKMNNNCPICRKAWETVKI